MKRLRNLMLLCLLTVFAACTDDTFVPQTEVVPTAENGSVDMVSMVVPDIEKNNALTRSKLFEQNGEMKFTWQENDDIGIIPMSGRPLSFVIHAENAGKNTALFDGGGWALKSGEKYAAFFPLDKKNQKTDIKHITYSYYGQTQGNFSKYDFLATGAVKPSNGQVTFNMKRLSAILKFSITMPANSYGRYGSLVSPDADFGIEGTLDLSGSEPVMKKSYSKTVNTQIAADKTSSSEWTYEVYLMIPATNLSGKELIFRITSDNGDAYEVPLEGKNFEAGKAYLLEGEAGEAKIRNKNLIQASVGKTTYMYVTDSEGNLCVNQSRVAINAVKEIDVRSLNDSTICDEIGYFKNLETLISPQNKITSLDVSRNTLLKKLNLGNNPLTSLDVSNNMNLESLICHHAHLTSLDIYGNTFLTFLNCSSNELTSLDVSSNTALERLVCNDNNITSLDVSNNTSLIQLDCYSNQLISLDVSNNIALDALRCYNNQLTSLDVSNNTALTNLVCFSNQLSSLDVSNNSALTNLDCYSNQLTSLDVSNNKKLLWVSCSDNPITELNISTSINEKMVGFYASNCKELKKITIRPGSSNGSSSLRELSLDGCTALESLYCENNKINYLYLSNCTALTFLNCSNNLLTSLDVSKFTQLNILLSYKNLMSELDVTACTSLRKVSIFCGNQYEDTEKTTSQTLTLKARASDTTSLNSANNQNVTVINQ